MNLYVFYSSCFYYDKGVTVPVEHYERLKGYYYSSFRDFFKVKNLKSILGEFENATLFDYSGSEDSLTATLKPTVARKLANSLNPYYENVLKNVEYMIRNTINSVEVDGVSNYVLFGVVRFKREKNQVKAYVRRHLELPENKKTRLNDCYILDEKNWVEINKEELLAEKVNELISAVLSKDKKGVINSLITVATNIEFYQGEASHLAVLGTREVGSTAFAISSLEDFYGEEFQMLRGRLAYKSHVYTTNIQFAFGNVAGLYMLIAEHDTYLSENNFEGMLEENTESLRQAINKIFNLEHHKIAESAYDALLFSIDRATEYKEGDCSKFIERDVFLHKHQKLLDLFGNDVGKLTYMFSLIGRDFHDNSDIIQADYFAYEKRISTRPFHLKVFTFPSKAALRAFLKLDVNLIATIVLCAKSRMSNRYSEILWRNTVFYLHYFNSNYKHLNLESFDRARHNIGRLYKSKSKGKINNEVYVNIARAVELILELAASDDYRSVDELVDYMNGDKITVDQNNNLVNTGQKNIFDISKRISLKQAMILQNEWHIALVKYEIQDELNNCNLEPNRYSHLRDVDVLIDGLRFKIILNKYELKRETQLLKHCVISYHGDIKDKSYIVFALTDTNMGEDRNNTNAYTLGCNINSNGQLVLNQVKGVCNSFAPSKIVMAVEDFLTQCNKGEIAIMPTEENNCSQEQLLV